MANESLMLMDASRVTRSLKRIAYQIAEVNKEDKPVVLLGINERGYMVAEKLNEHLSDIYFNEVESIQLLVSEQTEESNGLKSLKEDGPDQKFLVLVDDVIFSGTTMFRALKLISEFLDLEEVHTVVLIDRGHRKLPIDAQFVGLDLPTKLNEHVSLVIESEGIQGVRLSTV